MAAHDMPHCFTGKELADLALGRIEMDRLDAMAAHVDTCVTCQTKISDLSDDPDSFVNSLRSLPAGEPVEEETACRAALDELVEPKPTASHIHPSLNLDVQSIGAYRVLEPVGTGGMGVVFKARHAKLKRIVAIKVLPVQQWAGPAAIARFEREMEVIGGLDHPNIVRASDAGDEGGMHYLVMDFVDGLDLSRLARRIGPLPIADACEIIRQVAIGVAHVHDANLVHRDIKPSNIMLTRDGKVKILDLGLAMLGQQYREGEHNLTTIGQLMGTLDFMAPEQAADSHSIDTRADIYSMGATLFRLLTGRPPYGGSRYNSLLKKVMALANAPPPSAHSVRPEVSEQLDQVIGQALAKNPDNRFPSARAMSDALVPFSQGADLSALMRTAAEHEDRDPVDRTSWQFPSKPEAKLPPKDTRSIRSAPRRRLAWRILTATAAVILLAVAMFVVRLATNRGELLVRSDDPNAEILIRQTDGKAVAQLTLEKGQGKITVRSGDYAIELLGDADHLRLSQDKVTVSRGDQIVLEVERRPTPPSALGSAFDRGTPVPDISDRRQEILKAMAGANGKQSSSDDPFKPSPGSFGGRPGSPDTKRHSQLVYDGKPYSEWLQTLEVERSPERLLEAMNAVTVLGPEAGSEQAARAIFQVMRTYGSRIVSKSAEGKLIEQAKKAMLKLEPKSVMTAIAAEIDEGNGNSREFSSSLIAPMSGYRNNMASTRTRAALVQAAPEMIQQALKLSRTTDVGVSHWAMEFAASLVRPTDVDVHAIEGFMPRFHEAMKSSNDETVFLAASILSDLAPETPDLAKTLFRFIDDPNRRLQTINILGTMGKHAQPVLPELTEHLAQQAKEAAELANMGHVMGMGGVGGVGGMGGGMGGGFDGYPGRMGGLAGFGNDSVTQTLITLDAIGLDPEKFIPILQKLAYQDGPHQTTARKILQRIQNADQGDTIEQPKQE